MKLKSSQVSTLFQLSNKLFEYHQVTSRPVDDFHGAYSTIVMMNTNNNDKIITINANYLTMYETIKQLVYNY